MNEVDLVRLWVLNRLIMQQVDLGRLVLYPAEEVGPYWDFPDDAARECGPDDRLHSVVCAHAAGELVLYERVVHDATRHGEFHEFTDVASLSLAKKGAFSNYMAVITKNGHERWEEEFCPDWDRFWLFMPISEDDNGIKTYDIICASEGMLNEVLEGFLAYVAADHEYGISVVDRLTRFGTKAAFWKIMQTALQVRVQVESGSHKRNALLRNDRLTLEERSVRLHELREKRMHVAHPGDLTRLSTRW